MAAAGLSGILVSSPIVAPAMVERLLRAHAAVGDLAVVADSDAGLEVLAAAASPAQPLGVLVEIDVGQGRTGVTRPEDACRLARRIALVPQLDYRGVQAYYGHLQHVPGYADRKAKAAEQWARLRPFLDALTADGLAPDIITGGGTGTHQMDLEDGPFTEIQPGSYLFMDKQYGAIELAEGGAPFEVALSVAARVISVNQPGLAVIDAGFKAMATDAGPALLQDGAAALSVHGRRARRPALRRGRGAPRRQRAGPPGGTSLRPDRQSPRPFPRHAGRPAGRHLADRRPRLSESATFLETEGQHDRQAIW